MEIIGVLIGLAVWLAIGALGGCIGAARGQGGLGWVMGLLFGPISCIIAAVLPKRPPTGASSRKSYYSGGTGAVVDYQRWKQQQHRKRH